MTPRRAGGPGGHRRLAPPPDRHGQRHVDHRGEQSPPAVQGDAEDDARRRADGEARRHRRAGRPRPRRRPRAGARSRRAAGSPRSRNLGPAVEGRPGARRGPPRASAPRSSKISTTKESEGQTRDRQAPPHADGEEEAADLSHRRRPTAVRRVTAGSSRPSAPTPLARTRRRSTIDNDQGARLARQGRPADRDRAQAARDLGCLGGVRGRPTGQGEVRRDLPVPGRDRSGQEGPGEEGCRQRRRPPRPPPPPAEAPESADASADGAGDES